VNILADLAKIPTRIYEYALLVALVFGAGYWFICYEQDQGKKDLLAELDKRAQTTQKKLDKDSAQTKQQFDPRFNASDEAVKRYALPTPHPSDDCLAPADVVRAVNAAHQTGRP